MEEQMIMENNELDPKVEDKFNRETGDRILTAGIGELWEIFRGTELNSAGEKLREKVKEGINFKMDIDWFIKKWYTEQPKNRRVFAPGYGTMNIVAFRKELNARKDIMRDLLLQRVSSGNTRAKIRLNKINEEIENGR
jgi:hypothetical protein